MRPERVGAVVNPASGDGRGRELFADLAGIFQDAPDDVTVESTVTGGPEDVASAAREHVDGGVDVMTVVGGDGTLCEVASALYEHGRAGRDGHDPPDGRDGHDPPPLFVVPAGRGNSTYRHLYGDADWRDIARGLAHGARTEPLDLGRVETEPAVPQQHFLLGFTVGLFRHALVAAEAFRALPGPLAYLLGTTRAVLATDPVEVSVARDGEGREGESNELFAGAARLVAVGGGRYRGSAFELFPDSRPGDGSLHVLVVESPRAREAVRIGRLARRGEHVSHPAVHYFQGEAFEVRARGEVVDSGRRRSGGLPAEVDGTPLERGLREANLEVLPGALSFVVPDARG